MTGPHCSEADAELLPLARRGVYVVVGPAGAARRGRLRPEGPGGQVCGESPHGDGEGAVQWSRVVGLQSPPHARWLCRRRFPGAEAARGLRGAWPALTALPCQFCPSRRAGGVPAAVGGDPGAAAAAEPGLPAEDGICSDASPAERGIS